MHNEPHADSKVLIRLRDVESDDLPILYEHQADPVASEMAGFPSRDQDEFCTHWSRILDDSDVLALAILRSEQLVGNILSWPIDGKRHVGYWIARDAWGGGIATAALMKFLRIDCDRPLFADVFKNNRGSIRVLEKCGFEQIDNKTSPTFDPIDEDEWHFWLVDNSAR